MPNCVVTLLRSFPDRLQAWLPIVFLVAAGPLTAFLSIAVPAGEVPDESAHVARADSVSRWELSGFRWQHTTKQGAPETEADVRADNNLAAMGLGFLPGIPLAEKHVTLDHVFRLLQFDWQPRPLPLAASNTAVYPPTFYIPAAIAIRIARGAGLGPYIAFLAARLANALLYVAAGAAAIRMAQRGRVGLLCLLCLPMSLSLAASVNQDGLIIAAAALSAALLTRQTRAAWWAGAVLLGLAAMAKPYLALLAFALPVTYPGRLGRDALAGFLVGCVPAALWTAAMTAFVAVPFTREPPEPAGPLWPGPPGTIFSTNSPAEQLHILLASPLRLITLPVMTLQAGWEAYWREFIGVLGALDVLLPESVYALWARLVVLAIAGSLLLERPPPPARPLRPIATANAVILFSLVTAATTAFLLQYLSWTRVGAALIEGVQGRYFIPIAVFTLPLLQIPGRRRPWNVAGLAALTSIVSLGVLTDAVFLMLLTLFAYYTR
jgi:uncharacterized membrane protein